MKQPEALLDKQLFHQLPPISDSTLESWFFNSKLSNSASILSWFHRQTENPAFHSTELANYLKILLALVFKCGPASLESSRSWVSSCVEYNLHLVHARVKGS